MAGTDRLEARFAALKAAGRGGLVTFVTAGDPDSETSRTILAGLPEAGADIIELGMPFSDPLADGPVIAAAGRRALDAGMTLAGTLSMVRDFRRGEEATPVVLMGYYNPIHHFGVARFITAAADAGVDGLIIVDLPPEEDETLWRLAEAAGLHIIRLATPTSDDRRLPVILERATGFLYYVAVAGITGTRSAGEEEIAAAVARLRSHTDLPIAVGFGIKTPEAAAAIARMADAAVVGSAIVRLIADTVSEDGRASPETAERVLDFVRQLAGGVRSA